MNTLYTQMLSNTRNSSMFSRMQRLQIYDIATCHSKAMRPWVRGQLKCDGTRAETKFRLSTKQTSPFKSAGASVQSTAGSRGVRISGSNAGYTMFRGSVKSTGYPLHSPVSHSLLFPCVTVCRHISTGVYQVGTVYAKWTLVIHLTTTCFVFCKLSQLEFPV